MDEEASVAAVNGYRYGPYHDGPDPLEPPYDVRGAVDELGDSVLDGSDPASALRDLLRRGMSGHKGLDDLLRRVRERQRELRDRGRLDGILEQARALLDTAVGQERAELFPDPADEARLREAELDALPQRHRAGGQAARRLRLAFSNAARETFEKLKDLLRREVLDSQFRGMKQSLQQPDPEAMQRVKDMMAALNEMLDADARGAHTQQDFDDFMAQYGDLFPDSPSNLEELVDSLVRRMAAAQRLLSSLTDAQRDELAALMAQTLEDAGLAAEMSRLSDALRSRRPDIDFDGWPGERMTGEHAARPQRGDHRALRTRRPDRARGCAAPGLPGRQARRHRRGGGQARARPPGRRRHGGAAPDRAGAGASGVPAADRRQAGAHPEGRAQAGRHRAAPGVRRAARGRHRRPRPARRRAGRGVHRQHPAVELRRRAGDRRPDDRPQRAAAGRVARPAWPEAGSGTEAPARVRLSVSDFEVGETERRTTAAVCLLVDLSYSMALRGTWGVAKQTALALHALIRTRYPQDSIQVIGFSNYARELRETDLAGLGWDMVQGTNLHHALILAGRFLDRRPEQNPVC